MTEEQLFKSIKRMQSELTQARLLSSKDLTDKSAEILNPKVVDPLNWLQHHTQTKDPHWREVGARYPYRPFPDKPYFRAIVEALQREPVLFCAKSRDLMLSWLFVGYFTHKAMTTPGVEVLVQSQTEEKAAELIDYAKTLYERQDKDIKALYPLSSPLAKQSKLELNFMNGSRMVGIPHGSDKIRSYHPTALLMDEAAFIPDAGQSYDEAISACQQIVVLSSANTGWFESVVISADGPVQELATGVTERRTPENICVLRVHYSADPERRSLEWKQRERRKYTSESMWQSEQEIVFGAGGGERIFATLIQRYGEKILIDPKTSGFEPSPHWTYFAGFDFGKASPTAALVGCIDYDATIYILREYYLPGLSPQEHAPWLRKMRGFVEVRAYSDPSIFYQTHAQNDGTFKAIASLYAELGIDNLVSAPENNELLGIERILSHWGNLETGEPTLKIVCPRELWDIGRPQYGLHNNGCPNLLWELRRTRREESTPTQLTHKNPSEKIVQKDNHLRDCLKYMVHAMLGPPEKTWEMKAAEIIAPLAAAGDLTSASIRYAQMKAEAEAPTRPAYLGRQHRMF